jgi:hypothetical protein
MTLAYTAAILATRHTYSAQTDHIFLTLGGFKIEYTLSSSSADDSPK